MSHIRCQSCDEPWDTHYLRYDAIHETDLSAEARRQWDGGLTPRIRGALERVGYRCGTSIYSLKSCPCCPKDAEPSAAGRRRGVLADRAAELLADDLDGLQAEVTDLSD